MTHFLLTWLLAIFALTMALFPLAALIHLIIYRNRLHYLWSKLLWVMVIVLPCIIFGYYYLPYLAQFLFILGASAYGVLNFRSWTAKCFTAALIIGAAIFVAQPVNHGARRDANFTLSEANLWVSLLPPSEQKETLIVNLDELDQEIHSNAVTAAQAQTDAQLAKYLSEAIKGGMTAAQFKEWHSLMLNRHRLDPDFLKQLIQARGFNDRGRKVVLRSPGESMPPDTLVANKFNFNLPSLAEVTGGLVVVSFITLALGQLKASRLLLDITKILLIFDVILAGIVGIRMLT